MLIIGLGAARAGFRARAGEKLAVVSDHHKGSTNVGAKAAASRRDMAKIAHFRVAKPRRRAAPPLAPLLELDDFASYRASTHYEHRP